MTVSITKKDIEQILDTSDLEGEKRERCRKFLVRMRTLARQQRKREQWLPADQPNPIQLFLLAARTNKTHLYYALGHYWEMMFCDRLSSAGLYSHCLQRYKVFGAAHASINVDIPGKERDDYGLPDIQVYKPGHGLIAHVDVKHKVPLMIHPWVGYDDYRERIRFFGNTPLYYAVHNRLHFDFKDWQRRDFSENEWQDCWCGDHRDEYKRAEGDTYGLGNRISDWLIVRITPGTEIEHDRYGNPYIHLKYFKPLLTVLKKWQKLNVV